MAKKETLDPVEYQVFQENQGYQDQPAIFRTSSQHKTDFLVLPDSQGTREIQGIRVQWGQKVILAMLVQSALQDRPVQWVLSGHQVTQDLKVIRATRVCKEDAWGPHLVYQGQRVAWDCRGHKVLQE